MGLENKVGESVVKNVTDHPAAKSSPFESDGVPFDVYARYNVDPASVSPKDRAYLKEITEWALENEESLGDGLLKLSKLESQLGSAGYERRLDKVWRWVSLSKKINELEKRRESLRKQWV